MRVRVEWCENRRMQAEIEADSVEEVRENWDMGYESGMVDEIESLGVEIDGGIEWDTMTIVGARP